MGLVKCNKRVRGVRDLGVVLRCSAKDEPYYELDGRNMRQAMLFRDDPNGRYLLYYDSCTAADHTKGRLMLAQSRDLTHWSKLGARLLPGHVEHPGEDYRLYADYSFAGSPWIFEQDGTYYMYYTTSSGPDGLFAPMPYCTALATGTSLEGPWTKANAASGQGKRVCLPLRADTFYSDTACAGQVIEDPRWTGPGDREHLRYMMFFSAASCRGRDQSDPLALARGIGIARTNDLTAGDDYDREQGNFWSIDPQMAIPLEEDVENATLFYDGATALWYMFVNHIHESNQYTDANWVYWSPDPNRWDPADKAIVLDASNCTWTKGAIGLPTVARADEHTLAMVYDAAPGDSLGHFDRSIGLCLIELPLRAR